MLLIRCVYLMPFCSFCHSLVAYEFLANGFEEIEGLAPVDILRRGGVDIKTVSITGSKWVETSHGVTLKATCALRT